MCLGFMSFRAPSTALKQKNYHIAPNMQPIITLFQVLTCICVPFECEKNACLNYREFDLEGDLVGVHPTRNLLAQPSLHF